MAQRSPQRARVESLLVKDEAFQDARQEIIRLQAMESDQEIRMSQLQEQLLQSQNENRHLLQRAESLQAQLQKAHALVTEVSAAALAPSPRVTQFCLSCCDRVPLVCEVCAGSAAHQFPRPSQPRGLIRDCLCDDICYAHMMHLRHLDCSDETCKGAHALCELHNEQQWVHFPGRDVEHQHVLTRFQRYLKRQGRRQPFHIPHISIIGGSGAILLSRVVCGCGVQTNERTILIAGDFGTATRYCELKTPRLRRLGLLGLQIGALGGHRWRGSGDGTSGPPSASSPQPPELGVWP